MSYTIDFSGGDPEQKATQAIEATKNYLGEGRFTEVINLFAGAIEAGELTTRKQVRLGMAFAGVQGYPVDALIEKYWPSLPA